MRRKGGVVGGGEGEFLEFEVAGGGEMSFFFFL